VGEAALLMARILLTLLIGLQPVVTVAHAAEGDAARGERQFQRCYSCHSVDPNEKAKLQGPSLFRVLGRPAAAIAGIEYSDAMRAKGAAGLIWDVTALERFIADPESFLPGTLMSAPPLREEQDRADIVAYLALMGAYRQ
jgi:cytochrome c